MGSGGQDGTAKKRQKNSKKALFGMHYFLGVTLIFQQNAFLKGFMKFVDILSLALSFKGGKLNHHHLSKTLNECAKQFKKISKPFAFCCEVQSGMVYLTI